MNRQQYGLVLVLIVSLALAIAAAWYFGSASRGPIAGATATQTFRAKAGTQRENAKALISSRDHIAGKEGSGTEPVEVWGRFEGEANSGLSVDSWKESLRLAEEVIADLPPEEALAVLNVELERTKAPSALYAAIATLLAQSRPPDLQRIEDAFALALSTASTSEERLNVIFRHAKVYLNRGESDALLEMLDRLKPETAEFGAQSAEIEILRANAMWATNDSNGAMLVLERLVSHSDAESMLTDPAFENVYRQAVARLIRLYRETGNDSKAETLGRTFRSRLRQ